MPMEKVVRAVDRFVAGRNQLFHRTFLGCHLKFPCSLVGANEAPMVHVLPFLLVLAVVVAKKAVHRSLVVVRRD